MGRKFYQKTWFIVLMIFVFFPIGIILALINPFYSTKSKQILGGVVIALFIYGALKDSPNSEENAQSNLQSESNKTLGVTATENRTVENPTPPIEQLPNVEVAQASNVAHDEVVVDIIKFIENLDETNRLLRSMTMPSSDEEFAKHNELYDDIEDTKMDIASHLLHIMDKSNVKSVPPNIFTLYSENRYGSFLRYENVLNNNATYDKWNRGEYSYKVINGFWDGNTNYPVVILGASNSNYRFDTNMNDKDNTISVLDVNSIVYIDGAIYANVLVLNRWVAGNKLMESCEPLLQRFVFGINNSNDSEEQSVLDSIRVSSEEDYFISGTLNLYHSKSGISDWYNPSTSKRDFPETLEWALGKPGDYIDGGSYKNREILIFSIYKLSVALD